MKDTPILVTGGLIPPIRDRVKRNTRRPVAGEALTWLQSGFTADFVANPLNGLSAFGYPGDRLWVRETWQHSNWPNGPYQPNCEVFYRADYLDDPHGADGELSAEGRYRWWKPSIHMPRSAARLLLDVEAIRIERLQDITEADAIAEGVQHPMTKSFFGLDDANPIEMFRQLWIELYGPDDWIANPYVWVVAFSRSMS